MDRHDGRARAAQRQRVLRVDERRAERGGAARGSDHAMRSSCEGAPQLDRLDPVGDEVRPARHRRDPKPRRGRRPRAASRSRLRT